MNGMIYGIEFPNGKWYIGQTIKGSIRWNQHINASKNSTYKFPVYKAMNEYDGRYSFHVLEVCNDKDLFKNEFKWSSIFDSIYPNGYNIVAGGHGNTAMSQERIDSMKGENNHQAKPIEHYSKHPVPLKTFQNACIKMGWTFEDFKAIDSGLKYRSKARRFYWVFNPGVDNSESYKKMDQSGENNPAAKDYVYYSTTPVAPYVFKNSCKKKGWDIEEFKSVISEPYVRPNGDIINRYLFIHKTLI